MDKSIAGLLGAVSALALAAPAYAAVSPNDLDSAMSASSYADLLKPIPNAKALLDLASLQDEQAPAQEAAQEAAFDPNAVEHVQYHHHHHHHHHHWHRHSRWWWRHHRPPVVVINPGA